MKQIHVMFLAFACWCGRLAHAAATIGSNYSGLPFPSSITRYVATVPGEKWSWTGLAQKWRDQKPVKVLLLGGSISTRIWVKYFCNWVENTWPLSKCLNGAVSAAGPYHLFRCLKTSCSAMISLQKLSPDLVLVDSGANPWTVGPGLYGAVTPHDKASYPLQGFWIERIIRDLRDLPSKPLTVGINFPRQRGNMVHPYTMTYDDEVSRIFRYYGMPVCSLRNGLWPWLGNQSGWTEGKPWELFGRVFLGDTVHPIERWENELYADLIADCLAEGIQRTSVDGMGEPTRLPPLLTTLTDIEFRFPGWVATAAPRFVQPAMLAISNLSAVRIGSFDDLLTGSFDDVHSAGNVTRRVEQLLQLSAGVGLLVWDVLSPLTAQVRGLAVPPTLCPGLPWVRFYAHFAIMHLAIMHFYQLQPEALQVFYGFPSWVRWGRYWVPFFFMLSGFVMYLSGGRGADESADVGYVMGKRLRNLYPTFLLGLGIALLGIPEARDLVLEDPLALITTVSLTQVWIMPYGYPLLNGPSWFLSVLLVCYMMFPRWFSQVQRLKRCNSALVMLWMFGSIVRNIVLGIFVRASGKPLAQLNIGAFLDFSPFSNLHTFLMGLVLARIYCDNSVRIKTWRVLRISASSIMVGLSLFFGTVETPLNESLGRLVTETLLVPVFAILILSLACGSDMLLGDDKWGHPLFSDTLPGVSWCIYILHVPLFFVVQHPLELNGYGQPEIVLAVITAICVAVYVFYDKPLKLLLKKGHRRQEYQSTEESVRTREHGPVQSGSAILKSGNEPA